MIDPELAAAATAQLLARARRMGCACDPDVKLIEVDSPLAPAGVPACRAELYHDPTCPVLAANAPLN